VQVKPFDFLHPNLPGAMVPSLERVCCLWNASRSSAKSRVAAHQGGQAIVTGGEGQRMAARLVRLIVPAALASFCAYGEWGHRGKWRLSKRGYASFSRWENAIKTFTFDEGLKCDSGPQNRCWPIRYRSRKMKRALVCG
jgi:hypothetical protein